MRRRIIRPHDRAMIDHWPSTLTLRCELANAVGTEEPCPGASCALWYADGCVLGGLRPELAKNRSLAYLLLGLREQLERAKPARLVALPGMDP
jgi:hypothetical protein